MKNNYLYSGLIIAAIMCSYLMGMEREEGTTWVQIALPHTYIYPCAQSPCGNLETYTYSTRFPTAPKHWFLENDCPGVYRVTSTRWVSNPLSDIKGISFKGLIYKDKLGDRSNEFAVFFHEKKCYDGGAEYGWVFPENSKRAFFYCSIQSNLTDQQWAQWTGDYSGESSIKSLDGKCSAVEEAFGNPAKYHYWNIKITPNGNFLLEIVDPVTWDYRSCILKKPDWFPNLHGKDGYITINAQKGADTTIEPPAYMHIDEVKIWR